MGFSWISFITPPPMGFLYDPSPDPRLLRRQLFCLYALEIPEVLTQFKDKLWGILALPGSEWRWHWFTPQLLHVQVPPQLQNALQVYAEPLLVMLERTRQSEERAQICRLEAERAIRDRAALTREHLTFRAELLRENQERRKSQAALARSEERLRQSEKMRVMGQLAGGIAHDFNNMLTAILVAAEMLESCVAPEDREQIEMILNTAERAAELTAKLLTFSRRQTGERIPLDVHRALQETVSLLANTLHRNIRLTVNLEAERSIVLGDLAQLQSAFLNLGINAAQAMPQGGALRIHTRNVEVDMDICQQSTLDLKPGTYLEIVFEDTGCGIAPEHLSRIFEPFFTTKQPGQGTGLGLATVFGTLQQHQGSITVSSQLGIGSKFQILLPLCPDTMLPQALRQVYQSGRGRILLIEDEETLRQAITQALQALGYQVESAENGKTGLVRYQQMAEAPDLVILDRIMPEMDGFDCFRAIRALAPTQKILMTSGQVSETEQQQLKAEGLNLFLAKPFRMAELSQRVAELLQTELTGGA